MVKQSVSLKTVATACGLSVSTVSEILNDRPANFSSQATRRRVLETAKRLGYRMNFGYKLLHGKSTQTFALLLSTPDLKQEEHIRELIICLMDDLDRRHFSSYFSQLNYDAADNLAKVRDLMQRGVEHFIFIGSPVGIHDLETLLETSGKNAIGTSSNFRRHVTVDPIPGILQICQYLHGQAGEDFRFLGTPEKSWQDNTRFQALRLLFPHLKDQEIFSRYWRTLSTPRMDGEPHQRYVFRNARDMTDQLLQAEPGVRAICCHTDAAALGAANAILRRGLVIGRDVLLAGFNDNFSVQTYPYPISSVSHGWKDRYALLIDHVLTSEECRLTLPPLVAIRTLETRGKDLPGL